MTTKTTILMTTVHIETLHNLPDGLLICVVTQLDVKRSSMTCCGDEDHSRRSLLV